MSFLQIKKIIQILQKESRDEFESSYIEQFMLLMVP